MHRLHFSTTINAPKQKVWDTMLNDETYRQWTRPFHEGSYYEGSWAKGSKILFLGPNEGKVSGMVSRIAENKPQEYISIEHLGEVVDGVEDTTSDRVKLWAGTFENYTFNETDGVTTLDIDIKSETQDPEMSKMFEQMWPKALQKLKALAEQ
jgi:uncharacterized protein YndB with AHSA1/START domain